MALLQNVSFEKKQLHSHKELTLQIEDSPFLPKRYMSKQ